MAVLPNPGAAYARHGGAAPGRLSTYFNNPYMGQIANNLSSAIYGDPQDELTRERIQTVQSERARQADQDAIAAQEKADNAMYREDFAANFLKAGLETDPEARQKAQMEAYIDHYRQSGELSGALMPHWMNQGFQADKDLQGSAAANESDHIDQRGGWQSVIAGEKHGYNMKEDMYNRAGDVIEKAFGQGYRLPDMEPTPGLYPPIDGQSGDLGSATVLPLSAKDQSVLDGKTGGAAGQPHKITGTDVKAVESTINNLLHSASKAGPKQAWTVNSSTPGAAAEMTELALRFMSEGQDMAGAVSKAMSMYDMKYQAAEAPWLSSNTPESFNVTRKLGDALTAGENNPNSGFSIRRIDN